MVKTIPRTELAQILGHGQHWSKEGPQVFGLFYGPAQMGRHEPSPWGLAQSYRHNLFFFSFFGKQATDTIFIMITYIEYFLKIDKLQHQVVL